MTKFVIAPHMRLHEWVADEKGYFTEAGLDYEFRAALKSDDTSGHDLGDRVGAYQTFEQGRTCDVSSACHWTVNMAAAAGHGRIYVDAYSVSPCAIFVPPDSPIRRPEDLANVAIAVGYQSGSHYSTIEALDLFLAPDQIKLSFADGLLFRRMEKLHDREIQRRDRWKSVLVPMIVAVVAAAASIAGAVIGALSKPPDAANRQANPPAISAPAASAPATPSK